jgi:hypothetical protein
LVALGDCACASFVLAIAPVDFISQKKERESDEKQKNKEDCMCFLCIGYCTCVEVNRKGGERKTAIETYTQAPLTQSPLLEQFSGQLPKQAGISASSSKQP